MGSCAITIKRRPDRTPKITSRALIPPLRSGDRGKRLPRRCPKSGPWVSFLNYRFFGPFQFFDHTGASTELGGYNRSNVAELEGRYLCFRPLFSKADVINAYQMTIHWDDKRACLAFEEQNRLDARHTQKGQVFIPEGKPFMSLVTIDKGAIRVIMVSRPDETGLARGLVMTLSNPGGLNFIPATAPICLQRLGKQNPQVGFVRPGEPDYQTFLSQLASVLPDFGTFAGAKLGLEVTPGLEINNIHLVASNP